MDYHGCSWDGLTRTSEWFRTPGENEDLDNFGGSSAYAAMEPSSLGKFKSYDLRKQPFNLPEPLSSWPEMNDGRVMLAYRTTSLGNLWYHLDPSGTIWYLSPFAKNFLAKISGGQGWLKKLMAEGIFAIHGSAGISGGVVFFDPGWAGWEGCGRWIHPFTIFHQTKYGERSTAPGHLTHLIEEWLIMTDLTFKDTFGFLYFGKWIEMKQPCVKLWNCSRSSFLPKDFGCLEPMTHVSWSVVEPRLKRHGISGGVKALQSINHKFVRGRMICDLLPSGKLT